MMSLPSSALSRCFALTGAALLLLVGAGCDSGGDATEPPSVPVGLEVAQQDADAALSWRASTRAESYNVYRASGDATPDGSGTPANGDTPISGTSFTDTSVQAGTIYSYRVTAIGEGGEESNPSAIVRLRVFAEPPSRP